MEIIIKRALFNAEDFNAENSCTQFAFARNLGGYIAIEIADQSINDFKETLRNTYAILDSEYQSEVCGQNHTGQVEKRQMMIRQIITKMFKP